MRVLELHKFRSCSGALFYKDYAPAPVLPKINCSGSNGFVLHLTALVAKRLTNYCSFYRWMCMRIISYAYVALAHVHSAKQTMQW